jgi:hypothetical protein
MWTRSAGVLKKLWAVIAKNVISNSAKFDLDAVDLLKILRNGLLVGSSATILFLIENLAQNVLSSLAQGLAIAALNALAEAIMRYIKNNKDEVDVNES